MTKGKLGGNKYDCLPCVSLMPDGMTTRAAVKRQRAHSIWIRGNEIVDFDHATYHPLLREGAMFTM
jgi:hypothetical protein